ncbi:MAG: NTF2 fold immunity protein [Saprospiraceae bacterium]|nr:NTF2 fold immunity protein [Saprospiraceae bacterium]
MSDSLYQAIEGRNVKIKNRLIKTEKEAIAVGKSIFHKEFGEDYMDDDRRYIVLHIKGYWIVKGLQAVGYTGGTLVTVIDSKNGDIQFTKIWK